MPFITAKKENEREKARAPGAEFVLTSWHVPYSHFHWEIVDICIAWKRKHPTRRSRRLIKKKGKKETYLLCARVLIGADQSLSRGSILKQNIALFSQFTRQNHQFTGLFFSHVQDSWQIRRRSSSAQYRRMSSIPTGSLARGSSSDCNRLPSRESSWATTPSRPSWGWGLNHDAALLTNVVNLCFLFPSRNFASSAPNAAFSGATIGSPSPWCTPR